MGQYVDWADVTNRYPEISRVGGADEVGSHHIFFAEKELDSMLQGFYTTPFSSNNVTAKDLAIDLTYLRVSNLKWKDRREFRDEIMGRVKSLQIGTAAMLTTSGDVLKSVGEVVYSNTQDYHPVFGVGDTLDFVVDSSQIVDEEDARG